MNCRAIRGLIFAPLLMGAMCENRPDTPVPIEVRVAVATPCLVPEPECHTPIYNTAKKEMPADVKVKLLRAETKGQADCLRLYREALSACR